MKIALNKELPTAAQLGIVIISDSILIVFSFFALAFIVPEFNASKFPLTLHCVISSILFLSLSLTVKTITRISSKTSCSSLVLPVILFFALLPIMDVSLAVMILMYIATPIILSAAMMTVIKINPAA